MILFNTGISNSSAVPVKFHVSAFKTIAIVGGTSEIEQGIIKNLLATKAEFDAVILLTRDPDSMASKALAALGAETRKIPSELSAAAIPALVEALKRVDVLVSIVGAQALADQVHLIHASVQAGVKRFFPSEFGVDLDLQGTTIPFLGVKVPIRQLLRSEKISSKLEHENGHFMDVTVTLQSDVARFLAEILRFDSAISRNKTLKFEGDRFTFNQAREIVSKAVIHVPGVKSTFSTTYTAGLLFHNHNKLFSNVKPTSAKEYIATLF
ncbi:hypothetical protein CcCBS67573_g09513 [Chytriomyces confervae]|uniref:NmrA-like domain-containing protein n=1 Tax=Chytriomyces confervae TaxID=246404 RepID=A0A507DVV7_9FUNG|nr:hypothetical protein CcCBS67573_g09513 [Chytriomyces confervae]